MAVQQTIKTIQANNLTFSYYELGNGPLILCLHGFPDTANTWQLLMQDLAQSGYRVVAPFMRGYHPTTIPTDGDYSLFTLGRDVLTLIRALGEPQAGVIGHNWGALAAYIAAVLDPEKVRVVIAESMPHPSVMESGGRGGFLRKKRSFMSFDKRDNPAWIQRNDFSNLATIYKRWSPKWKFDESILHPIKETFVQAGSLDAVLGYYQVFEADRKSPKAQQLIQVPVDVETIAIFGEQDGIIDLDLIEKTPEAFSDFYEYIILPGVGHFAHHEAPQIFSREVLKFLHQKIPPATRPMRDT